MPLKRKGLASAQSSLSQPPKRSRKASPNSSFPCSKPACTALPSKHFTPSRTTRSSARRAALSSSVPPSPPSTLAHGQDPASFEGEAHALSTESDERRSVIPLQQNILTLNFDELQTDAQNVEERIGGLKDDNSEVMGRNKQMWASLNLPTKQIAVDENNIDTELQSKLLLANSQDTENIAIVIQPEKKIDELEEINRSFRAKTSKSTSIGENQHEEANSDEQGNISKPDNNALWRRITELDIGREGSREEVKELSRKVEEMEKRIKIGTKELAELQEELTECEDDLERVKEELNTVKTENANAEARLEGALVELKNVDGLADELMKSQRGLRLAKLELEKVQRDEKQTMRNIISKQKDLDDTLKDNQELEAKLEAATTSLSEKVKQTAQLEARYANVTISLQGAIQEITSMKAELAASKKNVADLEKDVDKHKNLSEHLQEAADGHLKTKRDLEKMVRSLTAEVVKTRGRPQARWQQKYEGRSGKIGLGLDWE